jgi:hypothetical protein
LTAWSLCGARPTRIGTYAYCGYIRVGSSEKPAAPDSTEKFLEYCEIVDRSWVLV